MPVIEFPYLSHKGYLLPIIPLTILNHKIWAYVDSGATFSIFDAKEAKRLGLELKRGTYQMIVVGDGSFIPTYFHEVPICIDDVEVVAQVGFSERLGVGFNLLGRKGVFDHFKICFCDKENKITFQPL